MGKVIFWIFVVFAAMFVLRLYNSGFFRPRPKRDAPPPPAAGPGEAMVRCARCGIYLPRSDAQMLGGEIRCRDPGCK